MSKIIELSSRGTPYKVFVRADQVSDFHHASKMGTDLWMKNGNEYGVQESPETVNQMILEASK